MLDFLFALVTAILTGLLAIGMFFNGEAWYWVVGLAIASAYEAYSAVELRCKRKG